LRRRSELVDEGELRRRERELLAERHPELELIHWTPEERARIGFDRGFMTEPAAVICPGELGDLAAVREKIVRSRPHWFGVKRLSVLPGWFLHPEHVEVLFGLAALQRAEEWDLGGHVEEVVGGPLTADAGAYALIDLKHQPVITGAGVAALTGHRGARRITSLTLTSSNLANDAARALAPSPCPLRLRRPAFRAGNQTGRRGVQALVERCGAHVVRSGA